MNGASAMEPEYEEIGSDEFELPLSGISGFDQSAYRNFDDHKEGGNAPKVIDADFEEYADAGQAERFSPTAQPDPDEAEARQNHREIFQRPSPVPTDHPSSPHDEVIDVDGLYEDAEVLSFHRDEFEHRDDYEHEYGMVAIYVILRFLSMLSRERASPKCRLEFPTSLSRGQADVWPRPYCHSKRLRTRRAHLSRHGRRGTHWLY